MITFYNGNPEYLIKAVLRRAINSLVEDIKAYGWSYVETDDAPETYSDLVEQTVDKCIPIANYACETAFLDPETNIKLRFIHDSIHLSRKLDFSCKNELEVSRIQLEYLSGYFAHYEVHDGISLKETCLELLHYDFHGQTLYYDRYKEFVNDQTAFIDSCFRIGLDNTLRYKW